MKSEIKKQKKEKLNSKLRILNTIKINELLDKNLEKLCDLNFARALIAKSFLNCRRLFVNSRVLDAL